MLLGPLGLGLDALCEMSDEGLAGVVRANGELDGSQERRADGPGAPHSAAAAPIVAVIQVEQGLIHEGRRRCGTLWVLGRELSQGDDGVVEELASYSWPHSARWDSIAASEAL